MKYAQAAILAAALWLSFPAATPACSLAPGYLHPSNFELVRDTPVIVLAKALKVVPSQERTPRIEFDVVRVLKGALKEKTLTFVGWDRWEGGSNPEDFSGVRRGALTGACNAYDYKLDLLYVLFIHGQDGQWNVSGPPFCRINEDVSGPDAPWAQAVSHYIRIAALGTVDLQKAALRELETQTENPTPGLAADIRQHFAAPHGSKPYEDLKKIYDDAQDERIRANVLWAFAQGKHTSAVQLICDLIDSGDWAKYWGPVTRYAKELKSASVSEALLKQVGAKKGLLRPEARRDLLEAISESADAGSTPALMELLVPETSEDRLTLLKFFVRHPDPKATAIYSRMAANNYEESPNLLLVSVAAMGDRDVLTWALTPGKTALDQRLISLQVFAASPLPEADQAAQDILNGTDYELILLLMQSYRESRTSQRIARLLQGFELREKNPRLETTVREVLGIMARAGDSDAEDALKKLPPSSDR
jgi:hypothetical protein